MEIHKKEKKNTNKKNGNLVLGPETDTPTPWGSLSTNTALPTCPGCPHRSMATFICFLQSGRGSWHPTHWPPKSRDSVVS